MSSPFAWKAQGFLDANYANLRRIQSSYFRFHFDEIGEVMKA